MHLQQVEFPNDMLEGMTVETILVSPHDRHIGVAALSSKEDNMYILRLYQLHRRKDEVFLPTHELESFSFRSKENLNQFLVQLPTMSAIDIILAMYPLPTKPH